MTPDTKTRYCLYWIVKGLHIKIKLAWGSILRGPGVFWEPVLFLHWVRLFRTLFTPDEDFLSVTLDNTLKLKLQVCTKTDY